MDNSDTFRLTTALAAVIILVESVQKPIDNITSLKRGSPMTNISWYTNRLDREIISVAQITYEIKIIYLKEKHTISGEGG